MANFVILIVDDDVPLASNLQDILEEEGYSVSVAHDSQLALSVCQEKEFNLALVDIRLPDIAGVGLIERLSEVTPKTEYIIITGYASLDSAIEAVRQKKIIAYETKPLDMVRLLLLIRQVAERQWAEHDARRAEEALRHSEAELQALSRRLLEVQEEERRAIGRELHDQIGQSMTVLMLALDRARHSLAGDVGDYFREVEAVANEVIAQVRNLSLDLRPAMLDDLGLLPSLLWHFERCANQMGVRVSFKHSGLDQQIPAGVSTAAYRIVQEALTNVARHAKVSEVTVRAWVDNNLLSLRIEDRGSGFTADTVGLSIGLRGMRERAALLGGRLTIESTPGTGTCILAKLPLSEHTTERDDG